MRYVCKPNGGAGLARNRGLRETTGDLVTFLDADDRWVPDKLARQLDHLARYPAAGLITGGECQVFEGGQPPYLLRRPPVGAGRLYPAVLIENNIGNPSLTLIRRACFDRVGVFDEGMRLGQDWDMWIRIVREFPVGVIDAPLITFTRHNQSLTAGQIWARYASNRVIHHRYISQVALTAATAEPMAGSAEHELLLHCGGAGRHPAHRAVAWRYALAAAALDPLYSTRLKAALLVRLTLGRAAFDRLRRVVRNERRVTSAEQ